MKNRVFGLDLVRSIAFFLVILVHSFMKSGFNGTTVEGFQMFFLLLIRCIAFTGVLLFMIITGYCMYNKKDSKKRYKSLIKILAVYFVISIITILFRKYYLLDTSTLYQYVSGIFNFTAIPYAWYVEMYVGLFLLIPFLNILYNNIPTKKQKLILILSLLFISSISTSFSNVNVDGHSLDLLPNWWYNFYPILLYYIGAYIKEYQITIKRSINIILIGCSVFIQAFITFFYCHGSTLDDGFIFCYENNLPSIILATLIFSLLYNVKTHSKFLSKTFYYISYVSFGGYLISYCCDNYIYGKHLFLGNSYYFFIYSFMLAPIVFILSSLLSFVVNKFVDYTIKLVHTIHSKHLLRIEGKETY